MARLLAGGTSGELVYSVATGGTVQARAGLAVTMYAGSSGATLADILTEAGGSVAGAVLTTDANGLLPVFQLPDGVDTVWALPAGGVTRVAVRAETDARLDSVAVSLAALAAADVALDTRVDAAEATLASVPGTYVAGRITDTATVPAVVPGKRIRFVLDEFGDLTDIVSEAS